MSRPSASNILDEDYPVREIRTCSPAFDIPVAFNLSVMLGIWFAGEQIALPGVIAILFILAAWYW